MNLLCVEEELVSKKNKKLQKKKFAWITDLEINRKTALTIMQGGRARWHIKK